MKATLASLTGFGKGRPHSPNPSEGGLARRWQGQPLPARARVGLMPEGLRRVLWFVGLWVAGVLAVGTVGLLIRWALRGAG